MALSVLEVVIVLVALGAGMTCIGAIVLFGRPPRL